MATASYAFPNAKVQGGGHAHSHSRKSMTQRVPLQPTSMNGGHSISGGSLINNLKFHANTRASAQEHVADTDGEHFDSTAELPAAHLHSQNSSAKKRPKVMDRRRSVGLPTHLSLRDSGYGYQPASNQKFMPIDEEAERKWITPSEIISVVLIPTPFILESLFRYHENTTPTSKNSSTTSRLVESLAEDYPTSKVTLLAFELGALSACMITSTVLLMMGLGSKFVRSRDAPSRTKVSYPNSADAEKPQRNGVTLATVRSIIGRILSVALPLYAAAKLGANRVALIMLVALATNLMPIDGKSNDLTSLRKWKRLLLSQRWTLASISLQLGCDLTGLTNQSAMKSSWMGYVALGVSVLALPPPFPSTKPRTSAVASAGPQSTSAGSAVLAKPEVIKPTDITLSPLICTNEDTNLTLVAGGLLAVLSCIILSLSQSSAGALHPNTLGWLFLSACATVLSYTITQPQSIRHSKGLGLIFGALLCALLLTVLHHDSWTPLAYQGVIISISFAAIKQDTYSLFSKSAHSHHDAHSQHHSHPNMVHQDHPSRFSEALLRLFQHWPILHSILAEKDSRRIFYFMTLNFAFMLVQTFYGIATGSLGLLSDSVHMFFDCLALVVGLCAAVMSKWPPSTRFPYGFGKVDTLAGFANGIFLMLISVEIVYEALERLSEGVEMQRIGELLTVSSLGLGVNLIGMTAFGHAHHGHSHGGHDQSEHSQQGHGHAHDEHQDPPLHTHHEHPEHEHHDHGHQGHSLVHGPLNTSSTSSPYSIPPTPSKPVHTHSHAHGHSHSHGNENMHGIFLHVLADTLGSVAVVISTLLIHYYGWAGFDPLASCLIAILIFASAIPLVTSSARTLLLTIPEKTEFDLREALAGVSGLRGVVGYAVPKFWLDEGEERRVLGVIHVVAGKGTDMEDVKERAVALLKTRNMNILVQVEREGSSTCWCQGTINR